jgi:hypothetical protein
VWHVQSGALHSTSKGERDEIHWRRRLSPESRLDLEIAAGNQVGIRLTGGSEQILLTIDKGEGIVEVFRGKEKLRTAYVTKARRELPFKLELEPSELKFTAADDNTVRVRLDPLAAERWEVSLESYRSQASFAHLRMTRRASEQEKENEITVEAREQRRLHVEDARRLLDEGKPEHALARLREAIGTRTATIDQARVAYRPEELRLLNEIAERHPALREEEPLTALREATGRETRDGVLEFHLPFRAEWQAVLPDNKRPDGVIAVIRCIHPALEIEVYRYDQRFQYWFGQEPKLTTVSGSSTAALARARCDDQTLELGATVEREPDRSRWKPGGQSGTEYLLVFPKEQPDGEPRRFVHQALFVAFRGNTYQFSIEASLEAHDALKDELGWLLGSLRFQKP